jgi:hypothetical protein
MRVDSELVSVGSPRRTTWALRILMTLLWGGGLAVFCGVGPLGESEMLCLTPLGLLVGTSILLALRDGPFAGAARRLSPGSLTIQNGLVLAQAGGQRRTFSVADVVSGWNELEGREGFETAVLLLRDGTVVRVGCFRHAVAESVLREAGVAPDQRAVKIRVRPGGSAIQRAVAILATFVAGIVALVFGAVGLVALVNSSLLFAFAFGAIATGAAFGVKRHAPALYATTLTIGSDGVAVESPGRRRFVRRADLADIVVGAEVLRLELKAGEAIRVPATLEAGLAVANRIRDTFQAPPASGASLDRLDRGDRPIAAWIAELRGRAGNTRGYREAALARDDLLDLLKDGSAPTERRVAAAVALSAERDATTRTALRVVANTCVDDRLRVVIGRAAEMADEELAVAVAEATAAR